MTLTEYINQKEPARMLKVQLSPQEYIKDETLNLAGGTLKLARVTVLFPEHLNWSNQYVQKNGNSQLMTMDGDGNPKSYSCFYI